MRTRITELLGIEHPIFQAAMSWASSNAPLVVAVSNAGGLGVLGAGPLRPDDFEKILVRIQRETRKPFGVNIPLNGARAPELLEIALQKKIPVMVASQGGPREQMPRFRAIGTKWLHVVASVEHAKKAEAAGVDALVVDGAEAGGHPPPSQVGTIVLVRRIVRATRLPVVASGGVADGAGIAALLALGAEAVQLGTRFIATPEASVHDNYKRAVLAAGTVLTRGTPVFDLVKETVIRASPESPLEIPAGAVVVPGARAVTTGWGKELGLSLQTPVIVKYRDERTDLSTALESWLR